MSTIWGRHSHAPNEACSTWMGTIKHAKISLSHFSIIQWEEEKAIEPFLWLAHERVWPIGLALRKGSQLWEQHAHNLWNDPGVSCRAARHISSVLPPREAQLQSSILVVPHSNLKNAIVSIIGNGSTQSDHFKIHSLSRWDFRQNASYGFFLICNLFPFIGTIEDRRFSQLLLVWASRVTRVS